MAVMAVLACIVFCGPFAAPGGSSGFGGAGQLQARLLEVQQAAGGGHGSGRMLSALPAAQVPGNSTSHAAALEVVKGGALISRTMIPPHHTHTPQIFRYGILWGWQMLLIAKRKRPCIARKVWRTCCNAGQIVILRRYRHVGPAVRARRRRQERPAVRRRRNGHRVGDE